MKKALLSLACVLVAYALIHAASEKEVDQTVLIKGDDMMKFDQTAFEVKAGSKVKITLKNVGKLPKIAMGHNLVLLKSGVSATAFGSKVLAAGGSPANPLPDAVKGEALGFTKLLGPGESDGFVITAPPPGVYEYVCTFPGHFALMRGVMTSK